MLNDTLQYADFKALSPLLLLLLASLAFLLIESFAQKMAKRLVFPLAIGTLLISLVIAYDFPVSNNPLLTPWISFDATARQFTLLFLGIGLASTLLSYSFFKRNDSSQGEYLFFLFSCIFGLLLIGMSVDFLTLFLGIETLSIATYILCGYMKKWKISHEAALKYFLMGALAAAFLLYGIALIYGATGTTNFKELLVKYQQMNNSSDQALFLAGVALVNLGLAFKAALVPFHLWAPDVYEGSPTSVVAFMAVGTKAGAFAAFTRVFLMALPHFDPLFTKLLLGIAYITLIYANLVAIQQFQLRRFFAYSGIAQAGFLLIPFIIGTNEALSALMFYLVVYTIATLGAFVVLTFLDEGEKPLTFDHLKGLFHRSPFLGSLMTLSLVTLAGIPPFVGFFAKFYLFKLAFQQGYLFLVILGLITTIFSIFYYMRIVGLLFTQADDKHPVHKTWPAWLVGVAALIAIFGLTIYPESLIAWISGS